MANNDPIKEYNPMKLRAERLKEKIEMNIGGDDPVTDLHDCSNDLSDEGSKKEEIAHSEFANKVRQNLNQYNNTQYKSKDVWEKNPQNINKNSIGLIIGIFIIFWIISSVFSIIGLVFSSIGNLIENVIDDQMHYLDEQTSEEDKIMSESDFERYIENISVQIHTTDEGKSFMELKNTNNESISNVDVELVFFDENNNLIKVCTSYIGGILGRNTQFYELYDVPTNYSSFQYNIVKDYNTNYSNWSLESVDLKTYLPEEKYSDLELTLKNNTNEDMDSVEIYVTYFEEGKLVDVKSYYFFDLESGKEESRSLYLYQYDDMSIGINEINIY